MFSPVQSRESDGPIIPQTGLNRFTLLDGPIEAQRVVGSRRSSQYAPRPRDAGSKSGAKPSPTHAGCKKGVPRLYHTGSTLKLLSRKNAIESIKRAAFSSSVVGLEGVKVESPHIQKLTITVMVDRSGMIITNSNIKIEVQVWSNCKDPFYRVKGR